MEINWSIIVSIASLAITVYTIIRTNAKSEEKMQGEIGVIKNDIKHLSDKVEKHNGVIERTYKLEQNFAVLNEEMKVEQHRTEDLENGLDKVNDKITNITRRNSI